MCMIFPLITMLLMNLTYETFINIYCLKIIFNMSGIFKKMFIGLLSFSESLANECMSLNNEQCKTKPFLIDTNPVELKYYPYFITSDKCNGSCNTFNEISRTICVPNKTKDVNLNVFNLITTKNESKTLIMHISCKCKCRFDGSINNSNWVYNSSKCGKCYIWNRAKCAWENSS